MGLEALQEKTGEPASSLFQVKMRKRKKVKSLSRVQVRHQWATNTLLWRQKLRTIRINSCGGQGEVSSSLPGQEYCRPYFHFSASPLFLSKKEGGNKDWAELTSLLTSLSLWMGLRTLVAPPFAQAELVLCFLLSLCSLSLWQQTPNYIPSYSPPAHCLHRSWLLFLFNFLNSYLIYLMRLGSLFLACNNVDVSKKHFQSTFFFLMQKWCHFNEIVLFTLSIFLTGL